MNAGQLLADQAWPAMLIALGATSCKEFCRRIWGNLLVALRERGELLEAYRRWGICWSQSGHLLAASGAIQCRQSAAEVAPFYDRALGERLVSAPVQVH